MSRKFEEQRAWPIVYGSVEEAFGQEGTWEFHTLHHDHHLLPQKHPLSGLRCPLSLLNDAQTVFNGHERSPAARGCHRPCSTFPNIGRHRRCMSSRTVHDRYHLYPRWNFWPHCPQPPQIRIFECRLHLAQVCRRIQGLVGAPGTAAAPHLPNGQRRLLSYAEDNTGSMHCT